MTPEEQTRFVSDIQGFSHEDIDRLYRVLLNLEQDQLDLAPANVKHAYLTAYWDERRQLADANEPCIKWLLDLLDTDPDIPLNEKFLDVLQEANIVLTADGTTTDGGVARSEASIESIDENDPLWQQAVALDNRKLASQALELWRAKVQAKVEAQQKAYEDYENPQLNAIADAFYNRNLGRRALWHWRNTAIHQRRLEEVAIEHCARKDAAFALKHWTLAARESLFTRVRSERLAQKAMDTWREKTRDIREMEAVADDFRNHQAVRNTLGMMAARREQIKKAEQQAVLVYEGNLARKVFNKWLAKMEQQRFDERKADAAADYFALKHALNKWRAKARSKKEEEQAMQAREHMLVFKYGRRWREIVRRRKHALYDAAYKRMRKVVKMNIARAALNIWRQKTAQIRAMRMAADEFRARRDAENAQRIAHGAIVTMYNRTQQIQEANQQADEFYNRNLIERLQIFGSNWLIPTRQILENQQRADEYRATRSASYAVSVLRSWKNMAFRARRLEEDADVVYQRNERRRVWGFLQRWRRAVPKQDEDEEGREEHLVPATPAARRSQLLNSTTPAYTPAAALFGSDGRVEEIDEEE
ncbi:hypothetical protein PV11_07223 [Exophiala sideris]|uniref:Sfi1 spindle body domain-containing protein n=1 Tax=Exophiala sideris TaxID=1016849 RepID=A0A0D1VU40_9EURO|nr:hypothetical protein PV11_07223 [Exophiala sideris]